MYIDDTWKEVTIKEHYRFVDNFIGELVAKQGQCRSSNGEVHKFQDNGYFLNDERATLIKDGKFYINKRFI